MLPQLERALIAGHDIVVLGERGQGKTRLLRTLTGLLDEWTPVIAGSEIGEHPYDPITVGSRRRAASSATTLPISWRHRSERYTEKLATPDTAVADLIGDVDPVKVAEGRSLGDPETIHFGLVPRAHRGIMAINELPDLAERIQVALLNVMEERDIQVRGYTLRLPLDVLLVASANPEDYTNRGRIITPLKDRFGAEIRTHYPLELADEIAVIDRKPTWPRRSRTTCWRSSPGSPGCCGNPGRSTRARGYRRGSPLPRPKPLPRRHFGARRSPVSRVPMARPIDLESVPAVLRGKLEFVTGQEGREDEVLEHLLRRATADTARRHLRGVDLTPLVEAVTKSPLRTGDRVTATEVVAALAAGRSAHHRASDSARPDRGPGADGLRRRTGPGTALPHPETDQGPFRRRRHGQLRLMTGHTPRHGSGAAADGGQAGR